jgi:hypothetical protein
VIVVVAVKVVCSDNNSGGYSGSDRGDSGDSGDSALAVATTMMVTMR